MISLSLTASLAPSEHFSTIISKKFRLILSNQSGLVCTVPELEAIVGEISELEVPPAQMTSEHEVPARIVSELEAHI